MSGVHLDVLPDPAHVRLVRLVAVSLARLHGVGEEVVEDVRLAVGEACGRAVAAQVRAELEEPVAVDFAGGSGLTVTVSDTVALPVASGPDAVLLLAGAAADSVERPAAVAVDAFEAAPEVIGLLEGLADDVSVRTGRSGTALALHWSRTD